MPLSSIPEEFYPAVKTLAREFFTEGVEEVYVACSKDRVYVGIEPVKAYKDKAGSPDNVLVTHAEFRSFFP